MAFLKKLEEAFKAGKITSNISHTLANFYTSYSEAITDNGQKMQEFEPVFAKFLSLIIKELEKPYSFSSYHQANRKPFDYYSFGLDIIRPLIDFSNSKVLGLQNVSLMEGQLAKGENVVLFANHQTEPDPQVISLLLEKTHPQFAEQMIFIAGHRVITDPLAIPFSKGRNLLCIYSKKHLENPPELKQQRLLHNQRTMKKMSELLAEGGKAIYVAPSGGRDRPNKDGTIEVAPFDPQSVEMFWLMSQQSKKPTHFYPLALSTYNLLPPPHSVDKDIGEHRHARCTPAHLSFSQEIDMINFPGSETSNKQIKRKLRTEMIWKQVCVDHNLLINN